MAGERTFVVKILGNADGAITAFKKLGRQASDSLGGLEGVGRALTTGFAVAAKAAAALGAAAGAVGAAAFVAIQQASDLNETISKSRQIFGDASRQIEEFAQTAARELGQTRQQAIDGAASFGIFGKAAGLSGTDLSDFSIKFTKLASDLASFNNTSPEDAILALGAALRGESEPIRRYGVLLNDAALKQVALELGIYDGNGALSAQQKVLAASEAIFRQTGDAQGDFARTSDGLANQQRILRATLSDISTTIGELLLPAFLRFVTFINNNIVPALQVFADNIKEKGIVGAFKLAIASMGEFGLKAIDAFEIATLAVLNFTAKLINSGQTIGLVAAAFFALTGNAVAFAKVAGAVAVLEIAETKLAKTTASLPGYFDNLRKEVLKIQSTLPVAVKGIVNTADVLERMAGKAQSGTTAVAGLDEVIGNTGRAGGAVDKAKEALKKYTSALEDVARAEKSVGNAQKSRSKAGRSLAEASADVAKAQEKLDAAMRGQGADSAEAKDAARELARSQRDLERAGYAVEGAVFAVADAEKKLAELRAGSDTVDIRDAEEQLAKARKKGDNKAIRDAEEKLAELRRGATSQEIREAEIELAEAKLAVIDATDGQISATDNLSKAQEKLNEIVNGAVVGSATYNELLERVEQAKQRQADAQERYNETLETEIEAIEKLGEAYKDLAKAAPKGFVMPTLPTVPSAIPPVIPSIPSVPTPTGPSLPSPGTVSVTVNTGVGTNGVEAGRQIAELLQQFTSINPTAGRGDAFRQYLASQGL